MARKRYERSSVSEDHIYVAREAADGPNATTTTFDIPVEIPEGYIIEILGSELNAYVGLSANAQHNTEMAMTLDPEETVMDRDDDAIIHYAHWDQGQLTSGGKAFKSHDYRTYPGPIPYIKETMRVVCISTGNLSGVEISAAIFYRYRKATQQAMLGLLRRQ